MKNDSKLEEGLSTKIEEIVVTSTTITTTTEESTTSEAVDELSWDFEEVKFQ